MSQPDPASRARELATEIPNNVNAVSTLDELSKLESATLGKTSEFLQLRASIKDVAPERRKDVGQALNEVRQTLEAAFRSKRETLETSERSAKLASERLDLTEVTGSIDVGHTHLITRMLTELEDAFVGLGFSVAEGPESETDWYNFEALNIPYGHPARSMWDTLYLDAGDPETIVLRTHTSPVQVRTMIEQEPPIYIVAPGRTFRQETTDATHLPVFHQIEGLVIDKGISFADLAGTIDAFVKVLFGGDRTTRLRPSYFPFTEPSAEFDMTSVDGSWMELGGCGMVHPNVLTQCGLDPEEWSGFAFGFGIERMVMQRYGISDIREFVTNDFRFLQQF